MTRWAWSEVEEEILLTNLTSLVDQGVWQAENRFHPGYLGVLENQMRVYFPEADAILRIPGFGWNPNENKLVDSMGEALSNFLLSGSDSSLDLCEPILGLTTIIEFFHYVEFVEFFIHLKIIMIEHRDSVHFEILDLDL
ncbi:hypothetical protein RHMOL_Rhmol11G0084400 [Rhododendron molle]|uniref:Uncharacterized protein n=1 Tax=Rhododendron molle TaxID=49168 RepID=A0ACC0LQE2_RHOML|nr:hypothetical protein RHMOL_Rhmol11G0084400 [Rhododendron molle]